MEIGILKIFQYKGKLFLRIYCWWLDDEKINIKNNMIFYTINNRIYKKYCENNYPGAERFIPLKLYDLKTLILDKTFRTKLKDYVKLSNFIINDYEHTLIKNSIKKNKTESPSYINIIKKYKKYERRALKRLDKMINKLPLEIKLLIELD